MDARDAALEAALAAQLKGCCFASPGHLGAAWRAGGGAIHAYPTCDSTMDRAHALAREGALVFALRQAQGRGRLGRRWESPEGGAYFSLLLKPSRPPTEIPQLSLVAGLAAAEAIHELTNLSPLIRWPNDLLLDDRKVAGILVEASTTKDVSSFELRVSSSKYVVVGMGINVTTDPKELPDTATSLSACGASCGLLEPVAAVCRHFDRWYDRWTAGGFASIREALRRWLNVGQLVRLTTGDSQTEGQVTDVDESGRLLVRLDSGVVRAFEAGQVMFLQ